MDFKSPPKIINKDYIFTFGKHKDESIMDVIQDDPQYVIWCADNIDWFDLATKLYDRALSNYHDVDDYSDMIWDIDPYDFCD